MPPYQNDSLHDMHALMQQLDTLNAAHAPEHLEGIMDTMRKAIKGTTAGKAIADAYDKHVNGKNISKEDMWHGYTTTEEKIIVLENTFTDIITAMRLNGDNAWTPAEIDALKNNIQSSSKAKVLLDGNIVEDPKKRSLQVKK